MTSAPDASRLLLFGVATILAAAGIAVVLVVGERRPPGTAADRGFEPDGPILPAPAEDIGRSQPPPVPRAPQPLPAPPGGSVGPPQEGPPTTRDPGVSPVARISDLPGITPPVVPEPTPAGPTVAPSKPDPPPPVPSDPDLGRARLYLRRPEGGILLEAQRLLRERAGGKEPLRAPDGRRIHVEDDTGTGTFLDAIASVEPDALRLLNAPVAAFPEDPIAALTPPVRLVGASVAGTRLACRREDRGAAVAALASLLAGDPVSAEAILRDAAAAPGILVLRGWAALLRGDLPAVHAAVAGLADDPDLGPVAHLLTGAALRADGNAREAVRDFEAAVAQRPGYWPAHLLAAEAYDSAELRLRERAAAAYAAAHTYEPRDLAAALGHAYHLAATTRNRAGARVVLNAVLGAHPDSVATWRMVAWWHAQGGSEAELRAAAEAFEHVTTLEPSDARAWSDLGSALWALAESGGGPAAAEGAIEAYARATVLAPEDPTTWARRGAALHQAALDRAASGDVATYRSRLAQARVCYGRALVLGVGPADAARVRFNLGAMADLLPPDAPVPDGATSARVAYAAALDLDPGYVDAATALVAAQIAARDALGAAVALARLPAATDPVERGVLEAAVAFLAGDVARARERLAGPGGVAVAGDDPRGALAGALLVLGHRRAAIAVVGEDAADGAAWAVRARAHAALREPDGVRAALARLETLDRAEAGRLRRDDPDVRAALK